MTTTNPEVTQEALDKRLAELRDQAYRDSVRADHFREAAQQLEDMADDAERSKGHAEFTMDALALMILDRYPHLTLPDDLRAKAEETNAKAVTEEES